MGPDATSLRGEPDAPPAWPPTAEPRGAELSVPAVLAILVGGYLAMVLTFAATSRGSLPYLSPYGSASDLVTRHLVVPSAIVVGLAVGLVLMLGWQRVAGLAAGSARAWGVVPLGIFGVATVVTIAIPRVSSKGTGFIGLVLLGLFFAALSEEILFRGFLLHGLARRIGGREAVLLGSALFAAAHIPSLTAADLEAGGIAVSLVVLFGLGVLLCRIRVATGSIWFASGVHTLWNFVTVAVLSTTYSASELPAAFVLLKLAPIVVGLVLAVRVARSPRFGVVVPPMPVVALAGAPSIPAGFARYSPIAPAPPSASPWVVAPSPPSLPPPPAPPRPDP
jgi:membrane protease YdiL (CAAX protease family)